MSAFACVVLLPEAASDRMDFVGREFATLDEVADALKELDAAEPKWRVVSFCHVEDLPLLMEPPDGTTPVSPDA